MLQTSAHALLYGKKKKEVGEKKKIRKSHNNISLSCDVEHLSLTQAAEHDKQPHY